VVLACLTDVLQKLLAELQDASSADCQCQQAGTCQPLWWWVLRQEGGIAGNRGGKVYNQATGSTGSDTVVQQGECATSGSCENCTKE
jgi:hypothetical protein